MAREARVQQEVLTNRLGTLKELADKAAREAKEAVFQAVESRRDELLRVAEARAEDARRAIADAVARLLPELLRSEAVVLRLSDSVFDLRENAGVSPLVDALVRGDLPPNFPSGYPRERDEEPARPPFFNDKVKQIYTRGQEHTLSPGFTTDPVMHAVDHRPGQTQ